MKLSARQLCFFLAAVAPAGKLVLMPSQLTALTGNDLLFPVLLQILVQAGLVFCVLLLGRSGRTVYASLADMVGTFAAKALCILFAAFLLFATFVPLVEQKLLVQSLFYDTLPSYVAFAPFFLFSAYLCTRPLAAMGRVWDILAPVFLVGMLGILLLSVWSADFGALAPVGAAGASGFGRGFAYTQGWFFDAALLLPLVGKFHYRKGLAWKGALCYLLGGIILLAFLATYYGVFADIAVTQLFAFAHMSKYFSGITAMGRIDYLFIFAVAFAMTFYVTMPVHGAMETISEAFGRTKPLSAILSVGFNGVLLALLLIFNFSPSETIAAITERAFWIFPSFAAGVPLLLLLIFAVRHVTERRRHAN